MGKPTADVIVLDGATEVAIKTCLQSELRQRPETWHCAFVIWAGRADILLHGESHAVAGQQAASVGIGV